MAKFATIRGVIAVAASRGLHLRQLDFTAAFLNGTLDETILARPPRGVHLPRTKCWKLLKATYGLRQAGRQWYRALLATLLMIGFTKSTCDPCLFTINSKGLQMYLLVYVDDVIVAHNSPTAMERLLKKIQAEYNIRDIGPLAWFLGVKVTHLSCGAIFLSQEKYLLSVLSRFNMLDCRSISTPGDYNSKIPPLDKQAAQADSEFMSDKDFRGLVGCLLYLACITRPDISSTTGFLARSVSAPSKLHWLAGLRVLRYLKGTQNHGLTYNASPLRPIGFADANWGGDNRGKSTSGIVFFLTKSGAAIIWMSKKQQHTALSSCESEFYALSLAVVEALWVQKFCKDLAIEMTGPVKIGEDNNGARAIAEGTGRQTRCKHMDIRYYFVQECVERKQVSLFRVDSNVNPADLLTKCVKPTVQSTLNKLVLGSA